MRLLLALAFASTIATSCYHVRTVANPETQRHNIPTSQTAWVLFWGLAQPRILAPECKSEAFQDVRTSTNLGYALLTVVTLGIVCPLDVEYTCAKPCEVIPTPQ